MGIILHRKYSSAFCLHVKQHHKSFGNMFFLNEKSLKHYLGYELTFLHVSFVQNEIISKGRCKLFDK